METTEQPAAWAAPAALAATLLSACGGGDEAQGFGLPAAMHELAQAREQPALLGRPPLQPQAAAFDATALMDWAERAYPQYFPGHQADRAEAPYLYRHYAETGNYLGVANGQVFVLGPMSGGVLTRVGRLVDFTCRADAASCAAPASAAEAARFLAQATLGSDKAQVAALQASSYATWIDAQLVAPRSLGHWDWLVAKGYADESFRNSTQGLDNTVWRKLVTSTDALRQRMVLALSEICVVSVLGISAPWRQFAVAHYLDLLEDNAFGNYRTLLGQVTLSTAMGYYLTYRGNAKANARGSQPDENYARELMQLFTIGLLQLDADGTPSGGETYGPADVSGLARVFTGWDLDTAGLAQPVPPEVHRRPMAQVASRYETGAKSFLGATLAAGTPAAAALEAALDTLFAHPNLPPFISRQLIQRLVTSNPSPAYVGRVAAAFRDDGAGVRGNLAAVLRALLLDVEAREPAGLAAPGFGKVREPVVRFLNWARAFNARSAGDGWAVGDLSDAGSRLGQSPLRSGSVFNFFRPGYVPPGSPVAAAGLAAPELQITNETSVAGYVNFMQRAISGSSVGDLRADYAPLLALVGDSAGLLAELNLVLAAGQIPAATLAALKAALDTIPITTDARKLNRVHAALTLVMAAPEYIVQK